MTPLKKKNKNKRKDHTLQSNFSLSQIHFQPENLFLFSLHYLASTPGLVGGFPGGGRGKNGAELELVT